MNEELVPLSEAKIRFHELVRNLAEHHVLLLRHGRPVGVMLSYQSYGALLERIDDLEDMLSVFEAREEGPDTRVPWQKLKVEAELDG